MGWGEQINVQSVSKRLKLVQSRSVILRELCLKVEKSFKPFVSRMIFCNVSRCTGYNFIIIPQYYLLLSIIQPFKIFFFILMKVNTFRHHNQLLIYRNH